MSDKKSKKSTDLEANLAKIANAKPRRRSRKNDIYERFITRVENVDGNDNEDGEQASGISGNGRLAPLKNADKLSSYEPLSAAELELFASQQEDWQPSGSLQRTSSKSTGVHLDFSDEDERLDISTATTNRDNVSHDAMEKEQASFSGTDYVDDPKRLSESSDSMPGYDSKNSDESTDNDHLVAQSPTPFILSKNKKLASSKKPLIIGMIVGSLLIAAVVLALIFTGVLSTSTTAPAPKVVASDNAGTSNGSHNSESNTINTATNSADSSNQSTVDTQPNIANTDIKGANNKQAAAINDSEDESTPEPAITYEDFREESQNTLYRETND